MKTDDLIALLASGPVAVEANAVRRRYAMAFGWGAFGATLLMALALGVRPDLAGAVRLPMFWGKLLFPAVLLGGALWVTLRLARPGAPLGRAPLTVIGPVIIMWATAAVVMAVTAPALRDEVLFGRSWTVCPLYIATLSAPAFVTLLWAMKGLGPTRLALAGGASGFLAGALGALVYALHCPEMAVPFLAVWYVLGMLIPAAAGAVIGPFLLRW